MNKDNLINLLDRSKEERIEIAKKGGIESGKSRIEKKTLKKELLTILNTIDIGDNKTIQEKMCISIVIKALEGNLKAFEIIRDTMEGKPILYSEIDDFNDSLSHCKWFKS